MRRLRCCKPRLLAKKNPSLLEARQKAISGLLPPHRHFFDRLRVFARNWRRLPDFRISARAFLSNRENRVIGGESVHG
jgi:hypothetical protein